MTNERKHTNRNGAEPPQQESPTKYQEERVREICGYLTEHLDQRMSQAEIAKKFRISLTALKLTFQYLYKMPINAYLRKARMTAAKQMLLETELPVSEIAHRVGYGSHSQFSAAFRASQGQSPLAYRRSARR